VVDARDYSPDTEATYEKTRRAVIDFPYFKAMLSPANPVELLPVTSVPGDPLQPQSKPFQTFGLRVQFADKFR
jgi:hypothetical protein